MATYILRDLDPVLWKRFKARANLDGWHLRSLFLQLLEDYARGAIQPTASAQPRPEAGFWPLACANGHHTEVRFTKASARTWLTNNASTLPCPTCCVDVPIASDDRDNIESWTHTPSEEEPA